MEPVVVCEFDFSVDVSVPAHLQRTIRRTVNIFNIGKETVPLDEEWPEGKHGPMQEVHHKLAATHLKKLRIRVMSDGNLVVVKH